MSTQRILASLARAYLGELLLPATCVACDGWTRQGAIFCVDCGTPPPAPPAADAPWNLLAGAAYEPPLSTAIWRMKFRRRPDLGRLLAQWLAGQLERPELETPAALVPVPLHPTRLVARGYNQAALIAGRLAKHWRLPWLPRGLIRTIATTAQTELELAARRDNVARAFVASPATGGRAIVLVDDVYTSGATTRACASALEAQGARVAAVVTLARTGVGRRSSAIAIGECMRSGHERSSAPSPARRETDPPPRSR